jgi:RNA polymerase sigma-70 factor (ECF subfamily)
VTPAPSETPRETNAPDDPGLVEALRAGDRNAFEAILRAHGPALLRVARRLLRNEDDAREAFQDACVSAFRSCGRFEGSSRVSTWLHRIVVNASLMRLRTQRRKSEVPIDDYLPTFLPDGHHEAKFVDWSNAAHAMVEQHETCSVVRGCIDRLPDAYRTVLLLRDIEGIPVSEVAAALKISPNAVNIRTHRARQALRRLLDPWFVGGKAS